MIKFSTRTSSTIFLFLIAYFAQAQKNITGTVYSGIDKKPVPEAIIVVKGTNLGTVADDNGSYALTVPLDAKILLFTYVGYQSVEVRIGEELVINAILEEGVDLNNVVVIGSRNASRTKIESPVPVDIIPIRSVVNEVGQVDINQILHYAAPSFQSNRQTISDGTDHIDPASLRGLGPDQVLVLINGKRRHTSALVNVNGTVGRGTVGTDLAAIPAHSIDRIEILRDGASAQYGSDAIAGVINIVLKKDTRHLSAVATAGQMKAGDGTTYQGSLNYGFKLGKKGYANLTAEYQNRGATNRMKAYTGPIWFAGSPTGKTSLSEFDYFNVADQGGKTRQFRDDSTLANNGLNRSDFNMRVGNSAVQSYGAVLNAAYPLTEKIEVYAFGGVNQKMGNAAGFYRLPNQGTQNAADLYLQPNTNLPLGFLPQINTNILDASGAVGVRGKIKNWDFDVSNTYGTNILRYNVGNSLNASREAFRIANPSLGLQPQTSFDCGSLAFAQNTTNIDFSHHTDNLFHGVNFAVGGEYRSDIYKQNNGEEASYKNYGLVTYKAQNGQDSVVDKLRKAGGAQVFPGFRPENNIANTRTNASVYADMEADFTANFMMGIAFRYENYSDFKETQNYKLVAKYKFSSKFMVRGALSTGFRAPSQQQKFFNTTSTQFNSLGQPFEVGTFRNDSPVAQALGIPKLRQESSNNYSAGFAFKPNEAFELTLDGYLIDIKDRIILTGQFAGDLTAKTSQDSTIFYELLRNNAQKAAFFTNAVDTRTYGLDLVTSYHLRAAKHDFRFVLAANYNRSLVVGDVKTTDLLKGKENIYFNREDRSRLEVVNPDMKATFSVNWKYGKWWAMLRNVYFGRVSYIDPNVTVDGTPRLFDNVNNQTGQIVEKAVTLDQTFAPKVVTDLTVGYQLTKNLNFSIGANNLLDVYPDKQTHSVDVSYGRFDYSRRVQQFGFNGAFYFARLRFDLK